MPRAARLTVLLTVVVAGGLAACAGLVPDGAERSAPGPAAAGFAAAPIAGQRLYVGFYDDKNQVLLELANESHPDFADVNEDSVPLRRATLKLAPDDVMQQLLAEIDAIGFDAWARPGLAPQQALRGWTTVQRDADVRTALFPHGTLPQAQWETFVKLKIAIASYYQRTGGLRLIDNPSGHDLFRDGR